MLKGGRELLLVSGYTGTGKTSLVNEIAPKVTETRGYFISGKFDQYHRDRPYSAFIQAFQKLVRTVLSESPERVDTWRKALEAELFPNARVMTEVIQELELIIGRQPDVPDLGPQESNNRFNHLFKQLIRIFASPEHPLVLFLDDLQWADLASMELMKIIMTEIDAGAFLIIGSYRDNEVDASHHLTAVIKALTEAGISVKTVVLGNIDLDSMTLLIAESLHTDDGVARPLSAAVMEKTGGNPFFTKAFLKKLEGDGVLTYSRGSGWAWDAEGLRALQSSANIVDLMREKILDLPSETLGLLKTASCIGNRFDPALLSDVSGEPLGNVPGKMGDAVKAGIVCLAERSYHFCHDRVQESVYLLVDPAEKIKLHYRTGSLLLGKTPPEDLMDKIFFIVHHLNQASILIRDKKEKYRLAELNFMAGKKARDSSAFSSALGYFKEGLRNLDDKDWDEHYRLVFQLHVLCAECEGLVGNPEQARRMFEAILIKVTSDLDRGNVYIKRNLLLSSLGEYEEALRLGLQGLKYFGIRLPAYPSIIRMGLEVVKVKLGMIKSGIEKVFATRRIESDIVAMKLAMLKSLESPAFFLSRNLNSLIAMVGIGLIMKNGFHPLAPYLAIVMAAIFGPGLGDWKAGKRFFSFSQKMISAIQAEYEGPVLFLTAYLGWHWWNHADEALSLFDKSWRIFADRGDYPFACHALNNQMDYPYITGRNLDGAFREYAAKERFISNIKDGFFKDYFNDHVRFYKAFKGETDSPLTLDMSDTYTKNRLEELRSGTMNTLNLFTFVYRLIKLNYLHGDYAAAASCAREIEPVCDTMIGTLLYSEYVFYFALSLAAECRKGNGGRTGKNSRKIKSLLKKMRPWASGCRENFLHKVLLVEAELAVLEGNLNGALVLYNESLVCARESGYRQNEGIAAERAAELCCAMGNPDYARLHFSEAMRCYKEWGASAKVKLLEKEYRTYLTDSNLRMMPEVSSMMMSDMLDLSAVMNMLRTISSERDVKNLFRNAITLTMQASGAQRVLLMMENPKDGLIYIQAEVRTGGEPSVFQSIPVDAHVLPMSVLNYVHMTKENILLDDALADERFRNDPYIVKNRSRSILCVPVRNKGLVAGMTYLENGLAPGVFTVDRQRILLLISAQSAIVIENMRLTAVEKQKAVLDHEIQLARNIQNTLLPKRLPHVPGLSLACRYVPMLGVGGDLYDFLYDEEKGALGLFICDVSGHGVHAAFLASMAKIGLHSWRDGMERPGDVLTTMYEMLVKNIGNEFISACACCLDLGTGRLTIASAGHIPLAVAGKNGNLRFVRAKGKIITSLCKPECGETTVDLEEGDTVILYTDGLTEARNGEGSMLGDDEETFSRWLSARVTSSRSMDHLCDLLYEAVREHAGENDLDDDFTVVAVKWK